MNVHIPQAAEAAKLESARYALIRRLGNVFRHHLVVNLQPLSMVCQVMRHRLGAATVDIAAMRDSVDQVERLVRTSIGSSMEVVSWLTPDAQATVALGAVVDECLNNVRSSFSFRGFVIRYEASLVDTPVSQVALREVLTAALIAATDHAKGLNEIAVTIQLAPEAIEISIENRQGANASQADQDAYRLIGWDDVQALADSHGLQCVRADVGLVKIRIAQR